MSLSNIAFIAVYLPLLLIIYFNPFFKSIKFKNVILLFASLGLYAVAEPLYVALLLLFIVFNYLIVQIMNLIKKKYVGYIGILFDLAILVFFKYANLFLTTFLKSNTITILFPIGLSYITFREISYIVDDIQSEYSLKSSFIETSLYLSNFAYIAAGPLGFFKKEINEIRERSSNLDNIIEGIERFSYGLIKKVIIADSLSVFVKQCNNLNQISVVMAWIGAIAYTLQLYFDFSGYTDMAIGVGKLFGFHFEENFNFPYVATSISEFWKRWHMSLTKWFTRYIYIPLGGSRVNTATRHLFNLWVVWLVTGLWHGSTLNFVLWGMIFFMLQALEKYTSLSKVINKYHLGHIYTMFVVIICWVIFKADNITNAFIYLSKMFGYHTSVYYNGEFSIIRNYWFSLITGILFSSTIGMHIIETIQQNKLLNNIAHMILFVIFIISIILLIGKGYSAPLYAGF